MKIEDYLIEEHTHRFAIWTAARAVSRSRLKNTEVKMIIDQISLRKQVEQLRQRDDLNDDIYKQWIKVTGEEICRVVQKQDWVKFKLDTFKFGLAAKIISIYLKTVEILPTNGTSLLSVIAYPPIDGILLRNLNAKHDLKLKVNWSTFEWEQYVCIIDEINRLYPLIPKWKIEVEWSVSNEEDSNEVAKI
jgi:hypothetical protein